MIMGVTPIKNNFNFSANKYKDWLSVPDNSSNSSNTTKSFVPINVEELNTFNNDSDSKSSSSEIENLYSEILMGVNNNLGESNHIGEYSITSYRDYAAYLETLREKASKLSLNKYDLYYAIASLRQKKYVSRSIFRTILHIEIHMQEPIPSSCLYQFYVM